MKKKTVRKMKRRERIAAAVRGEMTDRVPYALWLRPAPSALEPEQSAEQAWSFYEACGTDIVKTVNSRMYSAEDFMTGPGRPDRPVSVNAGALAREQEGLKFLLEKTKGEVPAVFTVLSPLATAEALCPGIPERIGNGEKEKIRQVLTAVTETTCELVRRVIELGADGIFLEAPAASYDSFGEKLYREYGMPYDLAVLSASGGWCNILHASGANILFPLLRKYPVQIFSWDAEKSLPEIGEAKVLTGRCIMAGLNGSSAVRGRRNEIERDIYSALQQTGGRGIILSPGCALPETPAEEDISFLKRSMKEIERKMAGR